MKRLLVIISLLLAAGCVVPPTVQGPRSLGEAAAMAPEGPRRASIHLVQEAERALARGEIEAAHGIAARALRVDQSNPYAYYVLTRIARAEGDRGAAERDLDQALRLLELQEPQNLRWRGRMLRLRAGLLSDQGRKAEAEELRREADRLDPESGAGAGPMGTLLVGTLS